ncbi:phosphotransferase family protein [Lacticaseibacillus mingshuiensis]|uniref:Phosphotransferase family protein n=1 Tax=Lacticaseibacillus mingshuiensis TaxID=2799574 RepID=A0ABW4CEW7_9LACO|nr:aminoglycoside phosphotransferase family protein [Lacticaseibacillus mingshuiensis]
MTSRLAEDLTTEQLRKIAMHLRPALTITAVRPLAGGLFNAVYLLTTTDGPLVLRIGPVHRDLLLPYERHLMQAEMVVDDLLGRRQILATDFSKTVVGRDLMLQRYLPGQPLSALMEKGPLPDALQNQLGQAVARIHQVTAPTQQFGRVALMAADLGERFATWGAFLTHEILTTASRLVACGLLTGDQAAMLGDLFRREEEALNEVAEPHLVHADLWSGNVLVSEDGTRIVSAIDFDRAIWGDPEFDFSPTWAFGADPAFARGYGDVPAHPRRRALYQMVTCALDAYVWQVEYGDEAQAQVNREKLLNLLDAFA